MVTKIEVFYDIVSADKRREELGKKSGVSNINVWAEKFSLRATSGIEKIEYQWKYIITWNERESRSLC